MFVSKKRYERDLREIESQLWQLKNPHYQIGDIMVDTSPYVFMKNPKVRLLKVEWVNDFDWKYMVQDIENNEVTYAYHNQLRLVNNE